MPSQVEKKCIARTRPRSGTHEPRQARSRTQGSTLGAGSLAISRGLPAAARRPAPTTSKRGNTSYSAGTTLHCTGRTGLRQRVVDPDRQALPTAQRSGMGVGGAREQHDRHGDWRRDPTAQGAFTQCAGRHGRGLRGALLNPAEPARPAARHSPKAFAGRYCNKPGR